MLVLTRSREQSIMVGNDVEIMIVDVRGNKVRLGITAPRSIPVHRREIYEVIKESQSKVQPENENIVELQGSRV